MAEKRQNKKQTDLEKLNIEYGKMPPQAVDVEEVLLGALMLESDASLQVIDLLSPESFYKKEHASIYEAIQNLMKNHHPVDLMTVTEELRKKSKLDEVGGPAYISQLTSRVATASHVEYHAKIVQQKYIQRSLIGAASEIQKRSYDEGADVDNLLGFAENAIFQIAEGNMKQEARKIDPIIKQAIEQIQEASKREDGLSGVPSGFSELDRYTSGWQPSDLVIIAARPSMGKTAFVLSMARNMAVEHAKPVAIFSLEMSAMQLVTRLISSETEISSEKLRNGRLEAYEWEQLDAKIRSLEEAKMLIDDTAAISVFELRAKARRMVQQFDVQAIVVDYLQLMTGEPDARQNRENEVSMISRSLKAIAKELNVPVIALSQLNRSPVSRTDKRPQLSDLRESGAIEQDADMVIFIHRPEYFNITEDNEGNPTTNMAEIILAKHRNGATGVVQLTFRKEFAKFVDMEGSLDMPNANNVVMSSKLNAGGEPIDDENDGNTSDSSPFYS